MKIILKCQISRRNIQGWGWIFPTSRKNGIVEELVKIWRRNNKIRSLFNFQYSNIEIPEYPEYFRNKDERDNLKIERTISPSFPIDLVPEVIKKNLYKSLNNNIGVVKSKMLKV